VSDHALYQRVQAEEEINDLVRQSRNGEREKAIGNEKKGIRQSPVRRRRVLRGKGIVAGSRSILVA